MSRKNKHHHKGNRTRHDETLYKPVPEIVPPGIITDPDSLSSSNQAGSIQTGSDPGVEKLRGWNQQNKM